MVSAVCDKRRLWLLGERRTDPFVPAVAISANLSQLSDILPRYSFIRDHNAFEAQGATRGLFARAKTCGAWMLPY